MAPAYHVQVVSKKSYGQIDRQEFCIWSYKLTADPPLHFSFKAGLGLPADLDIKDPAGYPDVEEIQGTFLDRSGNQDSQRVYSEIPPAGTDRTELTIAILAPCAENSRTKFTLQTQPPDIA